MLFDLFCKEIDIHDNVTNENIKIEQKVKNEKQIYFEIINNLSTSSRILYQDFWISKRKELPNLYNLSLIFFNIPASSASVERLFSICGIVNRKRAGNMNNQTLINRAFLKANSDLLEEMRA